MNKKELKINNYVINDDSECYVIAEIGHNHQGSIQMAMELFRTAKECGANAVKLQKRNNKKLYTKEMYNKSYDHENSFGDTYGEHREYLEFEKEEYLKLKEYAEKIGITFFATAFDFESADFLNELDMPAFKIASGDLTNIPLLTYIANFNKPMIVSTGGALLEDVERAYNAIMPINSQLCILQCTASYPADPEHLSLNVIKTYQKKFPDIVIGLSDHQNGIAMAMIAYTLGARVIEKHFTLNRALKGTDHSFSLEPVGLKKLSRDLNRARIALGDEDKKPHECEKKPIQKMGKKLVASKEIQTGVVLTRDDITIKSPNDGIPPYELDKVIGMKTLQSFKEDEPFDFKGLEK